MEAVVVKNKSSGINTQEEYFNLKVQNKKYPSCYHYNILVMLAKRLVKQDQNKVNVCQNRWRLNRKLVERIVDDI